MVARTDYTTARPPAPAPSRFAPALADAETALAEGRAADAQRVAKAISALVRAVREVAEYEAFARANWLEDDDEALRAELRRRLALLVGPMSSATGPTRTRLWRRSSMRCALARGPSLW